MYGFIKRFLDIILSSLAIILLFPLLVFIYILLAIQNKGSALFFQIRPGKNQRRIKVIKFKSMSDEKDVNGNLLPDVERITKLGLFLRNTSLDELPQLVNVLKGDMSIVGPRPLLFKYIPIFSEKQLRRHNVRPGITGWAQVNGRNSISWTKKFEFDVYYVDNISLLLDLKILWLTILKVLKKEGINQSEQRPMEPFNGTN